jgi:hypothetical protein
MNPEPNYPPTIPADVEARALELLVAVPTRW